MERIRTPGVTTINILPPIGGNYSKLEIKRSDGRKDSVDSLSVTEEGLIQVDSDLFSNCGTFRLTWVSDEPANTPDILEEFELVDRLFTPEELRNYDSAFEGSADKSINALESLVRSLFESITEKKFCAFADIRTGYRTNRGTFRIPSRIIAVTDPRSAHSVINSEFGGNKSEVTFSQGSVITLKPGSTSIAGLYGYVSVPNDIKMAAMILAGEYGCKESAWRAKYIETMKTSNWTVTFNEQAFAATGNIYADQILKKYIHKEAYVI